MAAPAAPLSVPRAVREAVLAWYDAAARGLAFRASRDPYAVLVSEVMAQQTQAARAAEAWTAWMARFPTIEALAAATPAEVLRAWAGLGYNRRAIALHRAASAIVDERGGTVPGTVDGLASLPGVGPYTARAVAAIAFGRPVGAVDTNVRRVLGRLVAGGPGILSAAQLQALADSLVPHERPGDWTHALMDLGATVCRARAPRCAECPVARWCRYAAGDRPAEAVAASRRAPGASRRAAMASHGSFAVARSPGRRQPPFQGTSRWLRGRILARARDAHDGEWVVFGAPIGTHDGNAVGEAVAALASEGLLEVREGTGPLRARLPGG